MNPCDVDPDRWYSDDPKEKKAAVGQCLSGCLRVEACLREVLRFEKGRGRDSRHGIWAGMTPLDRFRYEERLAKGNAS